MRIKGDFGEFISFRLQNAPYSASTRSNLDCIVVLLGVSAPEDWSQLQESLLLALGDNRADGGRAGMWKGGINWLIGRRDLWRWERLCGNRLSWIGIRLNGNEAKEVGWAADAWDTSSWGSTVDESVRHGD